MVTSFNYVNDLHLDHYVKFTTNPKLLHERTQTFVNHLLEHSTPADALVVAGDFGHVNTVSQMFLEMISPHYKRVFATLGNHDFYLISKTDQKKFRRNSYKRVQQLTTNTRHISNLTWLTDGMVYEYNGLKIAGHTMMACPTSPAGQFYYNDTMNDSVYIFFPDSLEAFHKHGRVAYSALPDDLDLFVSHYPLVKTPDFRNDTSQESYYNMVDELKAKHYMFGHVHQRDNFEVVGHQFHTHALGYDDEKHLDLSFGYLELESDV